MGIMKIALIVTVALVAALVASASASESADLSTKDLNSTFTTCGGNCPSDDCPSCPCGSSPNKVSDIATLCTQHDSGLNANAANYNDNGSFDVGLWQINDINWASCSGGKAPCDISTNLACAYKVWGWGGGSFKLWSTCEACGCC